MEEIFRKFREIDDAFHYDRRLVSGCDISMPVKDDGPDQ